MPWFLALQGPTHRTNESTVYQLADSANVERIRQQLLEEAAIGGVCPVPALFGNQQTPVMVYVRPVAWGLWTLYELSEEQQKQLQTRNAVVDALAQAMRKQQEDGLAQAIRKQQEDTLAQAMRKQREGNSLP